MHQNRDASMSPPVTACQVTPLACQETSFGNAKVSYPSQVRPTLYNSRCRIDRLQKDEHNTSFKEINTVMNGNNILIIIVYTLIECFIANSQRPRNEQRLTMRLCRHASGTEYLPAWITTNNALQWPAAANFPTLIRNFPTFTFGSCLALYIAPSLLQNWC